MNDIALTGKSQASALDIHAKIELQFLQKYGLHVIIDNMDQYLTQSYIQLYYIDQKKVTQDQYINYRTQQINNQNQENQVFFALRNFTFNSFSSILDSILQQTNVYLRDDNRSIRTIQDQAHKRQAFTHFQHGSFNEDKQSQRQQNIYELYANKLAQDHQEITVGEIVIIDVAIKCPSQRTKQLSKEIQKRIQSLFTITRIQNQTVQSEYIPYLRDYKLQHITLILLYNGEVNHDFSKSFQLNTITLQQRTFELKVRIYYISKQSLFSNFREINKQQNLECITDKIVTFYEMSRVKKRRAKILEEIDQIQQKKQRIRSSTTSKSWLIGGGFGALALFGIFLMRRKA
ncbi:hypothetical protein pb186bvf_009406 [Paramecium bursaria]